MLLRVVLFNAIVPAAAGACTADDATKANSVKFSCDAVKCAKSNFFKLAPTAACIQKDGVSAGCANCFGQVSQCVIKNCAIKCLTDPTSAPCQECGHQHCDDLAKSCTGLSTLPPDAKDCGSAEDLALVAHPPFAPTMPSAYEMLITWTQVVAGKEYHYTHKRSYDIAQQMYRDDQMDGDKIVTSTVYRPSEKTAYQYGAGGCTTWDFESRIDGFPPTAGFAFNQTDKVGDEFSKTFFAPKGNVLFRLDVWFHGSVPVQYRNTADEGSLVGGIKEISAYVPKIADPKRFTIPKEWGCKVTNIFV